MKSLRTKITFLAVCAVSVVMIGAATLGALVIKNIGRRSANQLILLMCETGEKNLDFYFESVEQSVEMVSAYVESDLDGLDDARLQAHLDRVSEIFKKLTYKTNGVLTYYYRIDPAVSTAAKGFWFINNEGEGFLEHEVTDITQYDTADTTRLVWFTVPKATGKAVWLPPYITDNLDVRVISYNVPVYYESRFVGVIGIEIDYTTMAEQVDNITLYENGYAFINDASGSLVYHPRMDVTVMETPPKVPQGVTGEDNFVRYTYEGVEKQAVWLPMRNGMRLNVAVPVSEINADWRNWIVEIVILFIALLIPIVVLIVLFTGTITRPLRELTKVAERVNKGDYDCSLDYRGRDEVGILAQALNRLTAHLKSYIGNLKDLAYADALTSVRNKGAFDLYIDKMEQQMIRDGDAKLEFAVCVFDCNGLKNVNDQYGHESGDVYLQVSCSLICQVFAHSPVYRIGGDEFATILQNNDFSHRDELIALFDARLVDIRSASKVPWERADVARGMAVYDPGKDGSVRDVVRRADMLMYENKRAGKIKKM